MNEQASSSSSGDGKHEFVEEVELAGHIIDSLLLPKVLDEISVLGGRFEIHDIQVGQQRSDPSFTRLRVFADSRELLQEILGCIGQHGALPLHLQDCQLQQADMDGAFPEGFYSTTNQQSDVRMGDQWLPVERQEMDCGIKVKSEPNSAVCLPMSDVRQGDLIVMGHSGVRVRPVQRDQQKRDAFSFMHSTVSSEKPKGVTVREIAAEMQDCKTSGDPILVVAGPAVVHTGSRDHFCRLIQEGFINVLFAGNALAAHDIEQSFYGTSLGISMKHGGSIDEGHEHHLRSINRIRRLGSIRAAVEQGLLTDGIMYQCIQNDVPFLLAGSIRDDGPLPDVVTDVIEAQRRMREMISEVRFCLMTATTLHSIAVGNLLPARVKVVCVDINPATVTKLADRGTFQTVGLVTDVEPFLRVLGDELGV